MPSGVSGSTLFRELFGSSSARKSSKLLTGNGSALICEAMALKSSSKLRPRRQPTRFQEAKRIGNMVVVLLVGRPCPGRTEPKENLPISPIVREPGHLTTAKAARTSSGTHGEPARFGAVLRF